jgi:hypothetical protein
MMLVARAAKASFRAMNCQLEMDRLEQHLSTEAGWTRPCFYDTPWFLMQCESCQQRTAKHGSLKGCTGL